MNKLPIILFSGLLAIILVSDNPPQKGGENKIKKIKRKIKKRKNTLKKMALATGITTGIGIVGYTAYKQYYQDLQDFEEPKNQTEIRKNVMLLHKINKDQKLPENKRRLTPYLSADKWEMQQSPPDGACLFHATSSCIFNKKSSKELRKLAVKWIDKNKDVNFHGITLRESIEMEFDITVDEYLKRMKKLSSWGGQPEIFALSHILNQTILVYSRPIDIFNERDKEEDIERKKKDTGFVLIEQFGRIVENNKPPIRLLYNGRTHYDYLQYKINLP